MNISAGQRRPFGSLGLTIPPIVFGTAALGNVPQVIPEQRKLEICGAWFRHVEPPVFIGAAYCADGRLYAAAPSGGATCFDGGISRATDSDYRFGCVRRRLLGRQQSLGWPCAERRGSGRSIAARVASFVCGALSRAWCYAGPGV